jgi:hypothetical protein
MVLIIGSQWILIGILTEEHGSGKLFLSLINTEYGEILRASKLVAAQPMTTVMYGCDSFLKMLIPKPIIIPKRKCKYGYLSNSIWQTGAKIIAKYRAMTTRLNQLSTLTSSLLLVKLPLTDKFSSKPLQSKDYRNNVGMSNIRRLVHKEVMKV